MAISFGVSTVWARETNLGRTYVATKGVYSNNLVFNVDFGSNSCYSGTGTSLVDLTGSYTGTLTNGPVFVANSYGGGVTLDGTNDTISFGNIATSSNVSFTNNFTIEQIFRPTNYQTGTYFGLTNVLISKGTASTFNYATQVTSDTSVSFVKRTGAEVLQYHTFTVPSMIFRPTVITFVITNGASGSGVVTCYQNGNYIGNTTIIGSGIAAVADDPLLISGITAANCYFTGSYYACRMYNTALTATDVRKNFNAIRGRYGI